MMRSKAAILAWSVWTLFVAITAPTLALTVLNVRGASDRMVADLSFPLAMAVFATVGALIASRRPENSIGWLFLSVAVVSQIGNVGQQYAIYAYITDPGGVGGGRIAAWMGNWLFGAGIMQLLFLLLLFPTGWPPSPRWRPVLWLAAVLIALFAGGSAFASYGEHNQIPNLDEVRPPVTNPFAIDGFEEAFEALTGPANLLLMGVILSALASLIVRARRSRGDERQQLKWFGYAAVFMVIMNFFVNSAVAEVVPALADLPFVIGTAALPVATGIAILKYRLYDIDLIINRTLVYGVLSAVLGFVYLGSVLLLQPLLSPIAADSDMVIAASTLAVAALFRPLRARVQTFIDRQFYRRKYDASETLEAFSSTLRDEIDLESLSEELVTVVGSMMQPAHASLWLRSNERRRHE